MRARLPEWLLGLGISLLAGYLLCVISAGLYFRTLSREDAISHQHAILDHGPFLFHGKEAGLDMWRNRILFPLLLVNAERLGVLSEKDWYLLLRWATASVAVGVFWALCRCAGKLDRRTTVVGVVFLSLALVLTFFSFGVEVPSDFPDVAFTAGLLWAALSGRRGWLVALALLGAANRESAAFGGIIWACVHGWNGRIRWRELFFGGAISVASYAATILIRWKYGVTPGVGQQAFTLLAPIGSLKFALQHPGLTVWPILAAWLAAVPTVLLFYRRAVLSRKDLGVLLAAVVIGLVTIVFGLIHELRVFLPSLTLLAYLCARVWREEAVKPVS